MYRQSDTIPSLRREIIEDSVKREKALKKLIKLVRADERQKTINDLDGIRARAERDRT